MGVPASSAAGLAARAVLMFGPVVPCSYMAPGMLANSDSIPEEFGSMFGTKSPSSAKTPSVLHWGEAILKLPT